MNHMSRSNGRDLPIFIIADSEFQLGLIWFSLCFSRNGEGTPLFCNWMPVIYKTKMHFVYSLPRLTLFVSQVSSLKFLAKVPRSAFTSCFKKKKRRIIPADQDFWSTWKLTSSLIFCLVLMNTLFNCKWKPVANTAVYSKWLMSRDLYPVI